VRHMRIDPREGLGDANAGSTTPLSVHDRMSEPAVIVSARASLAEALRLMLERRIHYLPVVDDDGHLVGMVNEDDVLGTRRRPRAQDDPVAAVMSAPAVSIGPAELLTDAMQVMVGRGIGALPVVQDGRVIGILTQSDVVAALARR
jgi:acetoin utilization protein AcuB